jgi:hypothetical protein
MRRGFRRSDLMGAPQRRLAACALLFLTGCVGTRATVLSTDSYPPVSERQVRIFLVAESVPNDCARIAVLRSLGEADFSTENQMIRSVRRRAGRLGANAVLLEYIRNPSTRDQVASFIFGTPVTRHGRAVAFRCPHSETDDDPDSGDLTFGHGGGDDLRVGREVHPVSPSDRSAA